MVDLLLAGRWVLAAVLVVAGLAKLSATGREPLVAAVRRYGLLPELLVGPAAAALPWLEITLGVLLCVGVLLVITAALAALLLGAFAASISWHLLRGRRFSCGCGRGGQISWVLVTRDLSLCAVAVAVAAGPSAGLAAWPGWGATAVTAGAQQLLPVPLIAVLAMVVARLVVSGWRLRRRRRPLAPAPTRAAA